MILNEKPERLYLLDTVKFFAIVLVCLLHYDWRIVPQGYLMVEIFFIITGLLTALRFDDYQNKSFFKIIFSRIGSFYILYIISIFAICIYNNAIDINNVLSAFFFLGEIGLSEKFTPGHLWFLGVYTYVYIFFVSMIKSFDTNKCIFAAFVVSFGMIMMMATHSPAMNINITVEKQIGIINFGVARGFAAMGLGFLSGMIYKDLFYFKNFKLNLIYSAIFFFLILYIVFHDVTPSFDFSFYGLGCVFIILVAKISLHPSLNLQLAKFKNIFDLSFSIYISHGFILLFWGDCLKNLNSKTLSLVLYFFSIITISFFVQKLAIVVEKIFTNIGRLTIIQEKQP